MDSKCNGNGSVFSKLSDDVVLHIFFLLQDDPRNWARLSCVSKKFSSLITTVCCKSKCLSIVPSVSADLLSLSSTSSSPPGGWATLLKLAVCCPGLNHSGVLLDNSDFGLHRELGPDDDFSPAQPDPIPPPPAPSSMTSPNKAAAAEEEVGFGGWSLYDDLYYDTVYENTVYDDDVSADDDDDDDGDDDSNGDDVDDDGNSGGESSKKKWKVVVVVPTRRPHRAHLASGAWNLSREQGNKLLASRFREDCLYICDWPGCLHMEEKRNYMLFRGFFKNFKRSRVWRTINDGNRTRIPLNCAFCDCKETWDLHSAFCLKRGFGFHDDGDPVVRAYVCENGHVSGAWTDQPLYT